MFKSVETYVVKFSWGSGGEFKTFERALSYARLVSNRDGLCFGIQRKSDGVVLAKSRVGVVLSQPLF